MTGERGYSLLSGQELKVELVSLVKMVPRSNPLIEAELSGRSLGELEADGGGFGPDSYISALTDRFISLLQRSHFTPSLREFLGDLFEDMSTWGEDFAEEDSLYEMLELDADHLGMFDLDRARDIARNIINLQMRSNLVLVEYLNQVLGEEEIEGIDESEGMDDRLIAARQEFIEKYGEEP